MADGGLEKIVHVACTGDCRWPPSGGHLRTFFLRSHADLVNDEFHQFRPWRVRDARHVCDPARCCVAWRRPSDVWFCRRVHPLRAWGRGLSFANSLCAARAYAGANTFDVRARAAATLYGVLGLFGEFRIAAANIAV